MNAKKTVNKFVATVGKSKKMTCVEEKCGKEMKARMNKATELKAKKKDPWDDKEFKKVLADEVKCIRKKCNKS